MAQKPHVVVAGHICLDIIPAIRQRAKSMADLVAPGKLVDVGPALLATGGAVSNTGLALHRLGVPVRLMGKVGRDAFGDAILGVLARYGRDLPAGMIRDARAASSYTVVVNPPGLDRCFLHCPGANDTFGADDIAAGALKGVRLFHFGYPPLMRRMYSRGGTELALLLERVKRAGTTTSLDMALPDPASEAGRQNWVGILKRVLPAVDVFLPSIDEILFMLRIKRGTGESLGAACGRVADRLLGMGVAVVALKLGSDGLYVRTTSDASRLTTMGGCAPDAPAKWLGRELLIPCYRARVVGTTGAGDCTIAGFLAGLLKGLSVEDVMKRAVGTGAFNVEAADATSGIPSWTVLNRRIAAGWKTEASSSPGAGWRWQAAHGIWEGPGDI